MNIWFVSKYASPPQFAKAPSRLFFLAKEFVKLGHTVRILTSDANHFGNFPETDKIYNEEEQDGVKIGWLKTKKYTVTASFKRIISWFDFERRLFTLNRKNFEKPDVVIVSSLSIFSIVFGYYLKKKYKPILVFEIRDIWPLTMTEEGGFSKWHPLVIFIGFIEKFGYKNSDLIVGTMPKLDKHVEEILGFKKMFHCSPIGFEPTNYSDEILFDDNNPFNKFIDKNKVIVGYAGSMAITNALEQFIESIKLLADNNNIHFLLVGSGDLRESYERELSQYKNVTFLDRIEQKQVKYFLACCDILYLSTQKSKVWDYGQSMNKVLEYMLSAKPIVATYSGYPSMINEASCGIFVNDTNPSTLKDAFLYYANMTPEERSSIGAKGRKWIKNYRAYSMLAQDYLLAIENSKK